VLTHGPGRRRAASCASASGGRLRRRKLARSGKPRKRRSPLLGGSSQRALRDRSPRQLPRGDARRGSHRPVAGRYSGRGGGGI